MELNKTEKKLAIHSKEIQIIDYIKLEETKDEEVTVGSIILPDIHRYDLTKNIKA